MSTTEGILLKRLTSFCLTHHIDLSKGVLVAFSGGADSLSLLSLLSCIAPSHRVKALYVNHNLRSEKELHEEIALNEENCKRLNVPLSIATAKKGEIEQIARLRKCGIEEAARYYRYRELEKVKEGSSFAYIATAHSEDDQKETLLMRLFQGSRLHFAHPIKAIDSGRIRPLLNTSRLEIEEYLNEKGFKWSSDSTKDEKLFLRSQIRHSMLPSLDSIFPKWREGLFRLSDELEEIECYLEGEVNHYVDKVCSLEEGGSRLQVSLSPLSSVSSVILRRLIYRFFNMLSFDKRVRLPEQSVNQIMEAIKDEEARGRIDVVSSMITFAKDKMIWEKSSAPLGASYISLVYSDYTFLCESYYLHKKVLKPDEKGKEGQIWIPNEVITGTLIVRSYKPNDTIHLKNGTKKVSTLFSEWGVLPSQRWKVPLLVDDRGVLAILGKSFSGNNRVAKRALVSPLAPKETTLYSVLIIEG